MKTRREVAREESGTQAVSAVEVVTPSGLRYLDLVRGGGETAPARGYLLAADVRVTLDGPDGAVLFDTAATQRPLAFFFGCVSEHVGHGLGRWTTGPTSRTRSLTHRPACPAAAARGRSRARCARAWRRPWRACAPAARGASLCRPR